jgi:hypothetical protein
MHALPMLANRLIFEKNKIKIKKIIDKRKEKNAKLKLDYIRDDDDRRSNHAN